jgi:hypothetical protein
VPPEQLPAAIQTLAEPLLNPIKAAMQQFTPSLGAGGETTLAAQLPLFDRLATLFASLPEQHVPSANILLQVSVNSAWHCFKCAFSQKQASLLDLHPALSEDTFAGRGCKPTVLLPLLFSLQAWPSLDVALLRAGQDNAALERLCR